MKKNLLVGAMAASTALLACVYGEYRYYCGKCESNKMWKLIVDEQSKLIDDMLIDLVKRES